MKIPRWRRRTPPVELAAEPIGLVPIGRVRNRAKRPQTNGWHDLESTIQMAPGLPAEMLAGLDGFSHVLVLFFLHKLGDDRPCPATVLVGVDPTPRGVLATRTQLRPNPIGVAIVPLLGVHSGSIRVSGLDALDGTPVLDIKPYIPYYDSVPDASVPRWVNPDPPSDA